MSSGVKPAGPPARQKSPAPATCRCVKTLQYRDRTGQPVSRAAWRELFTCDGYTVVACDAVTVAGSVAQVHTYWLGIADPDNPRTFRTRVPREAGGDLMWGWATEEEALAGHQAVCAWLNARSPLPAGLLT